MSFIRATYASLRKLWRLGIHFDIPSLNSSLATRPTRYRNRLQDSLQLLFSIFNRNRKHIRSINSTIMADLEQKPIKGGSLEHIKLRNTAIIPCNLEHAKLMACIIEDSSLYKCKLIDCTIKASTLQACDLFEMEEGKCKVDYRAVVHLRCFTWSKFPPEIRAEILGYTMWSGESGIQSELGTPAVIIALRPDKVLYDEALQIFFQMRNFTVGRFAFRAPRTDAFTNIRYVTVWKVYYT